MKSVLGVITLNFGLIFSAYIRHLTMPIFGFRNLLFQKTKVVLPHIGLAVVTALYICGGALIFCAIEGPNGIQIKQRKVLEVQKERLAYLESLWDLGKI